MIDFKDKKQLFNVAMYIIGLGIMLFLFVFLATCSWIGYGVRNRCEIAQQRYEGDCVEALLSLVQDESANPGDKNHAIWALGQLGDDRALPYLESIYTGYEPGEPPGKWDAAVSQYELSKAVKLLRGGFNLSAIVWR